MFTEDKMLQNLKDEHEFDPMVIIYISLAWVFNMALFCSFIFIYLYFMEYMMVYIQQ